MRSTGTRLPDVTLKSTLNVLKQARPSLNKSGVLLKRKGLFFWRDPNELELTLNLGGRRGLLIWVAKISDDEVEVAVKKTHDGCPGVGKSDFRRVYKGSLWTKFKKRGHVDSRKPT